jgi:hypothetical protein
MKFVEWFVKRKSEFEFAAALIFILVTTIAGINYASQLRFNEPELLEFKDGVQNHLVWSVKGECYFVRPNTSKTTFLIRVEDCDKK